MNLDQLNVFLVVARHLHFSRAADELFITQPAVSTAVAKLENEFGIKLFHRIGRRVELTDAGRFLIHEGSQLIEQVHQLERRLLEFSSLGRGVLTMGASFTVGNYWLPAAIQSFNTAHPLIEVQCGLGNAEQVLEGTARGEFDLGFVSGNFSADLPQHLAAEQVGTERLQVVVAASHPWFGRKHLTASELTGSPWIVRENGSGSRQIFEEGLATIGASVEQLPVSLVLNSSEMVKTIVLNGAGAAALPESMVCHEIALQLLWPVQVSGLKMQQSILVIRNQQRHESQVIKAFAASLNATDTAGH